VLRISACGSDTAQSLASACLIYAVRMKSKLCVKG